MKKLATAIAAIALIGTPAFAQVPPPAPVYNWTGWYVGGNIGASFGTYKTDFNVAPVAITFAGTASTPIFAGSDTLYPGGFVGGGQIGYNWQFSPILVVGLEADFQGALEKETSTLSNSFNIPEAPARPSGGHTNLSGTTDLNYSTKIPWFGTARVRIGYVFGDGTVMSYVTGGAGLRRGRFRGNEHSQRDSLRAP